MNKTRSFLENLVMVAIVLVLAQTFLEDLATVWSWSVASRQILLVIGFLFDVFFTVEFIIRSYDAYRYHRLRQYIWYDRGWIDFLASVPLLILNSGPSVLALYIGGVSIVGVGGMLNVLKVVKAIRIARVLRLLRVLKIFRKIKNADSVMAQRHVAMISAISVSVFVFILLSLAVGAAILPFPALDTSYQQRIFSSVDYVEAEQFGQPGRAAALQSYVAHAPEILSVVFQGDVAYSRYTQAEFDGYFQVSDYGVVERGDLDVFVDLRPLNIEQAAANLRYFVVIVGIILVFMFVYSPHFAITVTDPIHVMRRGLTEKTYSLEVKVPSEHSEDDIYQLASSYNETFLPMKDRENAGDELESGGGSQLNMGDMTGLFD